MSVLSDVLQRLGLSEYFDILTINGFHGWDTVLDITEDDLGRLDFKLGHRRILQREIATFRGVPVSESIDPCETPPLSTSALDLSFHPSSPPPAKEKRRYRRHPRPDTDAPKKPKTAYVNFADQVRTQPEVSSLSFVDIAREVGRQWQILPSEQKRVWEGHAARAMQEYEFQMDEYKRTDHWSKYQAYLNEFRTHQQQLAKPKRPTSSRVDSFMRGESSRASPVSPDSPVSLPSSTSTGAEPESFHNALTHAFRELVSLRGESLVQYVQPYDENHLPPEELTCRAMHAFVRSTGSLLYTWTYSQVDDIIDRVYRPRMPIDAMTLAECFTVAALGAHYDMECFPDHIRHMLLASATLYFNERDARVDYLRTMRLLLSLSIYALLETHMGSRYLLAAGLQIARSICPHQQDDQNAGPDSARRIFQSLIFVDSWLSSTSGYPTEVRLEDVSVASTPYRPESTSLDEVIQIHVFKVSLIGAEIANTVASPEPTTCEDIAMFAQKTDAWRAELPAWLQLAALTSDDPPRLSMYRRRAALMAHIMYFGALMSLYNQFLFPTSDAPSANGAAVDNVKGYREECISAARHVVQILCMLSFGDTTAKRNWPLIYSSFSACTVVLYSATTKLLEGLPEGVESDLAFARSCMDIFESCSRDEPMAKWYMDVILPLYDSLCDIHHRIVGRAKTSIFMLLQADPNTLSPPIPASKAEMDPILETLCGLLTDPFGRIQGAGRSMAVVDGNFAVFCWRRSIESSTI